ncbi:ddx52 [Symbiodinium sp. KB8]|nr:ddx52 [Symbiodinium sp. KB8]
MRSAERQTPKNAKPCLQLLYCPSVGVAAPCSLKPSREAFHKSTDAPKDRCRIVLGSNVVDRRGKTSDADKGVRQARRAGRALQPLGRQSQSLAGRARPEVETYIAQAVWQKCESPRCVLKLFCGILGLKPKWHRCVRHGKCEEKTPTFKQKSVRGPADWMDFFDVLRKGCTFGGTKKSKEVAFGKRKAPDPAIRPSLSTRSSTVLDYFGLDHADTAAKDQAEPKEAKVAKGAKANGQGYKRPGSWPKGEAKEQEEALDKRALQQKQEAVAALRRRHRIHISPGTPDLVESFDDMASRGVPPWLVRNLTSLGFSQPTPIQMQCFPAIMSGSHVLASAPTGSGKTIAFLGPILALLAKPGKEFARALVVDPSRELAKQTLDEFAKLTSGRKWNGRLVDKLSDKSNIKRLDVAVATPLRLVQLLRDNRISLDSTKHLVFDEADKLLDLGFAPQVDELLTFCPKEKGRLMQTMMFSATLPPVVVDLAGSILTSPLRISIGDVNAAAPDVEQKLLFITSEDGKLFSFRQLLQDGEIKPPALVFVQSKERAKELFGELVYDGIFVDAIHADRTKLQRDNTVKAFRAGKLWVLICTDLMARGVDFKGVETVINYDFPQSAATYIHRIGRTGRAGRNGKAITMFTIEDFESLRSIVGVMRQSGCEVPEWMLRLKARSKKERRMAEWRQPKRKRISTVSGYDRKKSHKRQQMVDARASALVFRWTSEDFRTAWTEVKPKGFYWLPEGSRGMLRAASSSVGRVWKTRLLAHTGSSKFHQIVARTKKSKNRPHILRAKFAVPSELELDLNLELRFCCTACNRALTLTAHGKVHVSTLWQPFDVHLSFESGSRAPAAGSRGAAFARVILCPSMLCNPTAGLLTLEVLPQYPGGPGVTELLEASEVHDAAHAVHDKPAGLRLLLDTDGSPALMLDGRTQDPATRRQLCVEVSSKDAMQNVLLEMQALSGARRILVSVCLAALGPLGDVPVLVHHLHFGSRCSLALLASFEARRHQVELRDSEVLKPLSPPPMVDSKTFSGATDKEQKCHRLAEGLRRLPRPRAFVPSPARPQAEQIRRRRSNSVERVVSHPFLEQLGSDWYSGAMSILELQRGTSEIAALGKAARWQAAVAKLHALHSQELQPGIVTQLSSKDPKRKDTGSQAAGSMELFASLPSFQLQPDMVKLVCWPPDAVAVVGLQANTFTGNAAMSALERGSNWQLAASILFEVITALGRSSEWQAALQLLEDFKSQELEPGAISFNASIAACRGAGTSDADASQWHLALHLLRLLFADSGPSPPLSILWPPDMSLELLRRRWGRQKKSFMEMRGRSFIVDFPKLEACSSLLSACGRAGRWQAALQAFSGMCYWGPRPDVAACGALLDSFARAGLWVQALQLLNRMSLSRSLSLPEPDMAAYTAVMSACAVAFKWEHAMSCLQDMHHRLVRVSVAACNAAALACERAVQVQPLFDLVNGMQTGRLQADAITYLALTSALGKGQQWQQALGALHSLGCFAVQPSRNLVNSAITACEKGHAWLSAMSVFRELHRLKIQPTVVSSSAAITAAAAQQEWKPAVHLLDDMSSWQVQPDEIAWNSMLDASELSSQWTLACKLLARMASSVSTVALLAATGASEGAEHSKALMPLLAQLRSQCKKDLLDEAQRRNDRAEEAPSSLSHVLEAHEVLAAHGAASSELQLGAATAIFRPCLASLQSLCDHGVRSPEATSQLWEPVLERQFSLGDVFTRLALDNVAMAERPQGHSRSSWSSRAAHASRYVSRQLSDKTPSAESLAGWLASSLAMREGRKWRNIRGLVLGYGGDSDEVGPLRQITAELGRICQTDVVAAWHGLSCLQEAAVQANVIQFNTVISGCQKHSNWQLALHLLGSIERQGMLADVRSCSSALEACSRALKWQAAVTLFGSCLGSVQPDIILARVSSAISACGAGSQWPAALDLLYTLSTWQLQASEITYTNCFSALARGEQWQHSLALCETSSSWPSALQILELMPGWTMPAYNSVLTSCVTGSRWDLALGLYDSLKAGEGLNPTSVTYTALMGGAAQAQLWTLALHLVTEMQLLQVRSSTITWNSLMDVLHGAEQWLRALEVFAQLPKLSLQTDSISFVTAIRAAASASNWRHAIGLLADMPKAGVAVDRFACSSAIQACHQVSQWQQAIRMFASATSQKVEIDSVVCTAAIAAAGKAGYWQHALGVLRFMSTHDVQRNAVVYSSAISACARTGQWQLVLDLVQEMVENGCRSFSASKYDHTVQAGSSLDCFKHTVLVCLLQHFTSTAEPVHFVDTHAGRGIYLLDSRCSAESQNSEYGISQMLHRLGETPMPPSAACEYALAVKRHNKSALRTRAGLRFYPGSTVLALAWLRPQDTATVFEISEEMFSDLAGNIQHINTIHRKEAICADSYWWLLHRHIPTGKALVMIDPPCDPYDLHMAWSLFLVRKLRFERPQCCILMWYPCLDTLQTSNLYGQAAFLNTGEVLAAEFAVEDPTRNCCIFWLDALARDLQRFDLDHSLERVVGLAKVWCFVGAHLITVISLFHIQQFQQYVKMYLASLLTNRCSNRYLDRSRLERPGFKQQICIDQKRGFPPRCWPSAQTSVPKARKPTGWDARDGPKYRRDFLAQQHAKVWKLQEQLSRCHVEKERQEQRFGHVRRALAAAKQELNTRGHERKPGVRSSRNKDSRPKGEASTSLGSSHLEHCMKLSVQATFESLCDTSPSHGLSRDFSFKAMTIGQDNPAGRGSEVTREVLGSRRLCTSVSLTSLLLGQVISVMNTLTGIFTSTLASDGISIPTIQSSLNYLLLAPLILLAYPQIRQEGLRLPWWRYALWALADVEGNCLVVLAYRYTSVASVMLLDGFTAAVVMLLSRLLLGTRYSKYHLAACFVCLCGLSLTVFADSSKAESTPLAWLGDLLVLLGCCCYASSNIQEEHLLKHGCSRYEALGMLGVCGSIISCIQAITLEGRNFVEITWSWKDITCLIGFQLCLFGVYMLVSIFLQIADAAVFNMSLLTCDVYSILFSWQVQHKDISWTYGPDRGPPLVAEQVCVVCGCLVPERSARYCAGCLPGTQREALDLRKSVGKSLATQASLQRRLEIQQEERAQLEVKHTDLEAKLYAAETGRPDH